MANYRLGKGRVYFNRFDDGVLTGPGFRFLGNCPAFSVTPSVTTLDHYSSQSGVKILDDQTIIQGTFNGSFTMDDIQAANIALFMQADTSTYSQSSTQRVESYVVSPGLVYQLGVSDTMPAGFKHVGASVTIKNGTNTLVSGTDYILYAANGLLEIVADTPNVDDGDTLSVTYTPQAKTATRVSPNDVKPVRGGLLFSSNVAKGTNQDYFFPNVMLVPNGDSSLIGDDWQTLAMNFSAMPLNTSPAFITEDVGN